MNSQREEELKPCPFCGSTDLYLYPDGEEEGHSIMGDHKEPCPFSLVGMFGHATEQDAMDAWNTRQAATEQGVGEPVTALCRQVFSDHPECNTDWEDHRPVVIGSEAYNHRVQSKGWEVQEAYTHPPKPTGGGVPDEVMARIKNLLLALGHQGVTLNPDEPPYDVGEWGIKEAQELCSLLATQQPPEQE